VHSAPARMEYVPPAHLTHASAPAAEYVPAGQSVQLLVASANACLPAAQSEHVGEAAAAEKVPAGQEAHRALPSREYCPAAHGEHFTPYPWGLPAVPAGQVSHAYLPPVLAHQ